jgi:hypothetical protein
MFDIWKEIPRNFQTLSQKKLKKSKRSLFLMSGIAVSCIESEDIISKTAANNDIYPREWNSRCLTLLKSFEIFDKIMKALLRDRSIGGVTGRDGEGESRNLK